MYTNNIPTNIMMPQNNERMTFYEYFKHTSNTRNLILLKIKIGLEVQINKLYRLLYSESLAEQEL